MLNLSNAVTQGLIARYVLFFIYISDLSEGINECSQTQYVDVTQFIHAGTVKKKRN